MPSILIIPDSGSEAAVERFKLRERISAEDLHDAHIRAQLLERIGWAVEDAELEERSGED